MPQRGILPNQRQIAAQSALAFAADKRRHIGDAPLLAKQRRQPQRAECRRSRQKQLQQVIRAVAQCRRAIALWQQQPKKQAAKREAYQQECPYQSYRPPALTLRRPVMDQRQECAARDRVAQTE